MFLAIVLCFILGYITIVLEHPLRLDKTVPALIMGALCWAFLAVGFHKGLLTAIDTHEHLFTLNGILDHTSAEYL